LSKDLVPYSANISIQTKTSSWAKAGQNASLCNFTDSVFWDVLFFLASFFQLLERLFVRRMINEGLQSVYDRLQVWTMKPEADYQIIIETLVITCQTTAKVRNPNSHRHDVTKCYMFRHCI
jgi:hypothetical protein